MHLSELNKLTVWYVTSLSGFMEWYVELFWEDCRYFCCSSQNNLMKGEIFLWSVSKIIALKSLLKSALTDKDAFDIYFWSSPNFILSSFLSFDKFEFFRRSEEVYEIGAFVFAGAIFFSFLFLRLFAAFIWFIH